MCSIPKDPFRSAENYTSFRYWKACDFIYHSHAVKYNATTSTLTVQQNNMNSKRKSVIVYQPCPININSTVIKPRIKEAKAFGIKNLMQVGSLDAVNMVPEALSDIAADPKQMASFVTQLVDIVHTYDFDGVYVYWKYPGCPAVYMH
jgi:GH18 family chitinase